MQNSINVREEQLRENIKVNTDQSELLEQQHQDILSLQKQLHGHERCVEHIQEQDQLIKNMERLQDETQQILTRQQASHQKEISIHENNKSQLEKKIKKLQVASDKIMASNKTLKESLKIKTDHALELERERDQMKKSVLQLEADKFEYEEELKNKICESCKDLRRELDRIQSDYDSLVDKFHEKCRQVASLEKVKEFEESKLVDHDSQDEEQDESRRKLESLQTKLHLLKQLVHKKDSECEELRRTHKQRLQRYNILLESHDLLKQQLQTYEDDSPLKELGRKEEVGIPRAEVKSLQREESLSVWNELEYFRQEFQKLEKERYVLYFTRSISLSGMRLCSFMKNLS